MADSHDEDGDVKSKDNQSWQKLVITTIEKIVHLTIQGARSRA